MLHLHINTLVSSDGSPYRRIALHNERQEEIELERRAIDERKERRAKNRHEKRVAKEKRIVDRTEKARAKQVEIERKRAIRAAKAATRLASTQ